MTIQEKANELCNDPKNDYKSTEDLCIMMADIVVDSVAKWLENHAAEYARLDSISEDYSMSGNFIEAFKNHVNNCL